MRVCISLSTLLSLPYLPAYLMAQVFQEAKLPPGVCNLVFGIGPSVGSALVSHPDVPLISFTGGTVTGRRYRF